MISCYNDILHYTCDYFINNAVLLVIDGDDGGVGGGHGYENGSKDGEGWRGLCGDRRGRGSGSGSGSDSGRLGGGSCVSSGVYRGGYRVFILLVSVVSVMAWLVMVV